MNGFVNHGTARIAQCPQHQYRMHTVNSLLWQTYGLYTLCMYVCMYASSVPTIDTPIDSLHNKQRL